MPCWWRCRKRINEFIGFFGPYEKRVYSGYKKRAGKELIDFVAHIKKGWKSGKFHTFVADIKKELKLKFASLHMQMSDGAPGGFTIHPLVGMHKDGKCEIKNHKNGQCT
jgi:hypothetical protein